MTRSGKKRSTTSGTQGPGVNGDHPAGAGDVRIPIEAPKDRARDQLASHRRAVAPSREADLEPVQPSATTDAAPHWSGARDDLPEALAHRAIVEHVQPQIDGGRFAAKRTAGDTVTVTADIFADGHDVLIAMLRDRPSSSDPEAPWRETPMSLAAQGTDEWTASFIVDAPGWHEFTVTAWVDRFATWRRELKLKAEAGQDILLELVEGGLLVREAAGRAAQIGITAADAWWLDAHADLLMATDGETAERLDLAFSAPLATAMLTYADRRHATQHATLRLWVDRERARFGTWYEMFPRSAGPDPTRSATFSEAAERLPAIAALGFDVLYLPPIHPIGHSFRKGANNSLNAGPDDPGSPWAIGSEAGGHTAVDPGLGTLDDFGAFQQRARELGLEVALDLAWQCSPDHPWVTEHPEWFRHRPDGTIKYAENPPKKYQDIYPLDFACDEWRSLWSELLRVTLFWVEHGVRIFRVDNPHTKSFNFWEWLIDRVHADYPDVIFLAEAFTRPKLMRYLAKAGFTQSYTYFTWRNTKPEIEEYLTELTASGMREYFRPNFFANTPDILHAYLQEGGRPAFEARLVLAATLSSTYGIYSGFELCENRAVKPGSEEYLDSEKYQVRARDWNAPGNINTLVARINEIRREHPALQRNDTLRFCATDNPQLIAYTKHAPDGTDLVLVIVSLDPHYMQHGHVQVPLGLVGAGDTDTFSAHDLLTGTPYSWTGDWNYVRLDPGTRQAHVLHLTR